MLRLTIQFGEDLCGQVFEITSDLTTIGRDRENSLHIESDYLSSFHAEIVRHADGKFQITDLDSSNGTFVNGVRIEQSPITVGDELTLGFLEGRVGALIDKPATHPPSKSALSTAIHPRLTASKMADRSKEQEAANKIPETRVASPSSATNIPATVQSMATAARALHPAAGGPGKSRPDPLIAVVAAPAGAENAPLSQGQLILEETHERANSKAPAATALEKARQRASDLENDNARLAQQADAAVGLLEKLAALENRLACNEERVQSLEIENFELTEIKAAKETEVDSLLSLVADYEDQAKKAASADAEIRDLKIKLAAAEESAEQKRAELNGLRGKIAALQRDKAERENRLKGEIESAWAELERSRRALDDFTVTAQSVRSDLEAQQAQLRADISRDREELENLSDKREQALEEANKLISELRTEADALENQVVSRRNECEALTSEGSELASRVKAVERELEVHNELRDQSIQRAVSAGEKLAKVESKLLSRSRLLEQLKTLRRRERAVRRLENEIGRKSGSTRSVASSKSQLSDLHRAIAECQKEHDQLQKQNQREQHDAERKLEQKLYELRLANDRIRYGEQVDRDSREKLRELADITSQLEATKKAVGHLHQERKNLTVSIQDMEQQRDSTSHQPPARPEQNIIAPQVPDDSDARQTPRQLQQGEKSDKGHANCNGSDTSATPLHTEVRLRELQTQISESENYLRIIRESIRLEDATVHVLTSQLIKRLDLIDDLVGSYLHKNTGEIALRLDQLRESFLEMLREHSIEPYSFEPGTQLSLARRRRIKVVESRVEAGPNAEIPYIVETIRPGYLCLSPNDVDDVILRKAQVITANT